MIPVTQPVCENCSTPLAGRYCHACGQKTIDPDHLTIRAFLREFSHEVATLDFKTVRTLRRLAVPGALTGEYLAGRRRPYLSPLRLYLLCAAIFFLAAPIAGFTLDTIVRQDRNNILAPLVDGRLKATGLDRALFTERFDLRLQTVYTVSLSVSVAAVAALLSVFFRRQRRPFGAHIVFALHYVAVLYLAAIVVGVITHSASMPSVVSLAIAYAVLGPYLVIALRRVYAEPLGRTLLKSLLFFLVTFVVDAVVNFSAFMLTLWLV